MVFLTVAETIEHPFPHRRRLAPIRGDAGLWLTLTHSRTQTDAGRNRDWPPAI